MSDKAPTPRNTGPSDQEKLENPKNDRFNFRYPENLASDSMFPHIFKITIYKQIQSKSPDAPGSSSTFNIKAGASARPSVAISTENLLVTAGFAFALNNPRVAAALGGAGYGLSGFVGGEFEKEVDKYVESGKNVLKGTVDALKNLEFPLSRTAKQIIGSIDLYMPETFVVNDRHDFDNISVTDALGLAGLVQTGLQGNQEVLATERGLLALSRFNNIVGENLADIAIAGKGFAINPLLQIVYQKTNNREFDYTFKFTPRSSTEAEQVLNIIKTLRYHSYPEYSREGKGSRYFVPPSEFEIEHWYRKSDGLVYRNESIPRIAQCVLSNISVNYGASGTYATFENGMPVEIDLILRFTETIALTKEDIQVGY
jgi:hypothetical protein